MNIAQETGFRHKVFLNLNKTILNPNPAPCLSNPNPMVESPAFANQDAAGPGRATRSAPVSCSQPVPFRHSLQSSRVASAITPAACSSQSAFRRRRSPLTAPIARPAPK